MLITIIIVIIIVLLYYCVILLFVVVLLFCIPLFTVYFLFSDKIRWTTKTYIIEGTSQLVSVLNIQHHLFNHLLSLFVHYKKLVRVMLKNELVLFLMLWHDRQNKEIQNILRQQKMTFSASWQLFNWIFYVILVSFSLSDCQHSRYHICLTVYITWTFSAKAVATTQKQPR